MAVLLVCATFPLIWVGGLVTSTDAGMAVPDWPSTFGYNLFLYPWQTWLFGPWDLFIEHGHRLLGALVGMITIGLLASLLLTERRPWVRWFAVGALGLVILQGVIGGLRVRLDERLLAMLHGCLGPLFFGVAVALAVVTSDTWRHADCEPDAVRKSGKATRSGLHRLALFTTVLAYLQLVLGAQLRHVPVSASPGFFRVLVWAHLVMAAVLAGHVILLVTRLHREVSTIDQRKSPWQFASCLRRPATSLAMLLVLQLMLGVGAWVVKYSWPAWMSGLSLSAGYTITANGWVQTIFPTAHAAIGSSLLAVSLVILLRSVRLLRPTLLAVGSGILVTELAA